MVEVVATMVVGPLLSMVKEKVSSILVEQYKVMEGMEDQHKILKRKLPAILDVISDAEQESSHREGVKAWLEEVKIVAYKANEVFDEFKYEALRREAKKKRNYSELSFDAVNLFPTHNRFVFRNRMGKKLCRIVQDIDVLVAEMNAFGFKHQKLVPASKQWLQTDSIVVDPENIVSRSREEEKEKIIKRITDPANASNLMVLPIVGMGGLGKTTLAQLVYNDPDIQGHFQLQRWVCVSEDFDVCDLAHKICQVSGEHKEKALQKLREELSGKRYFVVLDDVWNRDPDKQEKLKACLQHGGVGNFVLVTTRDNEIAQLMHTVKAHDIAVLEKKFIMEIIEKRAFGLQQGKPASELLAMVADFAERCDGSPLAAKALGSVLHGKTSLEEWDAVLQNCVICSKESRILQILKLSFDDLPSHLKQCFAFCAMFPKNYEIDVGKLIQLWIANGFIQEQKQVHPEIIGKRIFNELASRSFFQDVKQVPAKEIKRPVGYYDKTSCKIHDLMHDVALSTMGKECAFVTEGPSQVEWLLDTAQHLLVSCHEPETILNDALAKKSPVIKTLLCDYPMDNLLQHSSKYTSLQALQLCPWDRPFQLKTKYLHHLRYLDLSRSSIKSLPEDITILYNLRTLNLSGCDHLDRLPWQMKYMTALCHLYNHGCPKLKSIPPGLGELISLQTLTCFIADTGSYCSHLGELNQLNLGDHLEIHQLENVTEEEAKAANLRSKKELRELTLKWTFGHEDDAKVLEGLKPHDRMQAVRIDSYGATAFPTWMSMLENLVEIHLLNCKKLQFISTRFVAFPNLKKFTLEGLLCLERWCEINSQEQGKEIMFPQLEKLFVINCRKLTTLPEAALLGEPYGTMVRSAFPSLKVLYLRDLMSFWRWEAFEGAQRELIMFPQLEKLSIGYCPALTALSEAPLGGDYSMFPQLDTFNLVLPCIDILSEAPRSRDYSMAGSAFPALKVLKLEHLESFQRWDAAEETQGNEIMFPQLEKLFISGCGKLTALSGKSTFPNLQNVCIKECPELTTRAKSPKLNALELQGREEELLLWVARHETSLINLKLQNLEDTEINAAVAEHCLSQVLDNRGKWNHEFSLSRMELSGFKYGVAELCGCFVQLQELDICRCDALAHWPEKEFQSLVSLRKLRIRNCSKLTGFAQTLPESSTSQRSQLLPSLERMVISECENLVEVFKVPMSLKKMKIHGCSKIESIFGRTLHEGTSASLVLQGSSVSSEVSLSSARARAGYFLLPCVENLSIAGCHSLTGALDLAPSLEELSILHCKELTSLESRSGELRSLESLLIFYCENLSSLPDGRQAYSSLDFIEIDRCPGIEHACSNDCP